MNFAQLSKIKSLSVATLSSAFPYLFDFSGVALRHIHGPRRAHPPRGPPLQENTPIFNQSEAWKSVTDTDTHFEILVQGSF